LILRRWKPSDREPSGEFAGFVGLMVPQFEAWFTLCVTHVCGSDPRLLIWQDGDPNRSVTRHPLAGSCRLQHVAED